MCKKKTGGGRYVTVGNTTVFHGRYSLFHTVGPDSLAELTCIFLVCDADVANDI